MNEITVKKGIKRTTVVIYDDIEQLPITRFNKMNKYLMLNDNIGSDISDFDRVHYSKLLLLLEQKEHDKVIQELENFRILVYNIINEINVEHLAFACLIYSIGDYVVTDLTESGLKSVLKKLNDIGFTQKELKKKITDTKESIFSDLEEYFPEQFKGKNIVFWQKQREKVIADLRSLLGEDVSKEIDNFNKFMVSQIRPKNFMHGISDEVKYDREFEQNIIILSPYINKSIENCSTKEYFSLIEWHKIMSSKK